jgi:hypothetical protein
MKRVFNFFFSPRVAFIIFVIFITVYLILLDEEGAFRKKFLAFGPSKETKFLSMTLDTWEKVILVYLIGFFSSLLTTYYKTVSYDFIHSFIWNPAYKDKIKISKWWTSLIVSVEPLLFWVLKTLNFFVNLTMELQYIIPKFLGNVIINVPYGLYKVNQNRFVS